MFALTPAPTLPDLTLAIIREPLVVSPDTTVLSAITQMNGLRSQCHMTQPADVQRDDFHKSIRSSCVLVVQARAVVGILTERDLVSLQAQQQPPDQITVQQVMQSPVITLQESALTDLCSVIQSLQQHQIRHLPILDDQQYPVGLITYESLGSLFLASHRQQAITYQQLQVELSERQQVEQQLQQLNQALEAKVKERTRKLSQLNSLQRVILDGVDYSMISTDPDGIIQTVNAAAERMLGYCAEELVGQATPLLFHDRQDLEQKAAALTVDLQKPIFPGFEVLVANACRGIANEEEWTYVRKDGSCFPVLLSVNVLRDAKQQIIGFLGVAKDITRRKQAEGERQRLVQELSAFKLGLDESAIVAITNAKGVMTYVNDRFCAISGYSQTELLGQTHRLVNSGYHPPGFFQNLWHTIASGKVWRGEICNRTKNGSLYWVESTIVPFLDAKGQPFQYLAIRFDITARKDAEAQLQQTNEELARATRLKDEFLANMSHELRTPLNAILGMTEGLQEGIFGHINEQQLKSLQTIERSSSHLLELINDILDVAKIESGQIELDFAPTAVSLLCQSSLVFIKQQALKKHIQLEITLPPNLPDLWVDERRIRQVLINLLNNAVKFTSYGGRITLEVSRQQQAAEVEPPPLQGITRVRIHRTPLEEKLGLGPQLPPLPGQEVSGVRDYVRIAIMDTGIGIAPEYIHKLFQPFVQIDSALNRQYSGTGLGLALVKRIVELHGGQVGLTSEVGVGSCFTIDLPCVPASLPLPEPLTSSHPLREGKQPTTVNAPLLLLAEDNEAGLHTISSYLTAKGYRMLLAQDGQEALSLAQAEPPDLILMDIQMPKMDGLEAMRRIRQIPSLRQVPIIALTALAMPGDRERCLEAGANDYLTKPVKLKQLVGVIQQFLAGTGTPPRDSTL